MEDRVPARSLRPVPFDDPLEEDPDHPQTVPLSVLGHGGAVRSGLDYKPELVVLDVSPGDSGDCRDMARGDQPTGELPKCGFRDVDASWSEEGRQLRQVALHG